MKLAYQTQSVSAPTWRRETDAHERTRRLLREIEAMKCLHNREVSALQVPALPPEMRAQVRALPAPAPSVAPGAVLSNVRQLLGESLTRKALARIYDAVDAWTNGREFERCDDFLDQINLDQVNPTIIVGVLTITSRDRAHIARRGSFVQRAREHLRQADPARAEQLLAGLE